MKKTMINEFGEHIVIMDRSDRGPLTKEEQVMLADMDAFEDTYDEDCPEMPEEMILQMRKDIADRNRQSTMAN